MNHSTASIAISSEWTSAERDAETLALRLKDRIVSRDTTIGVIGLGYVGLPQARACCQAGFRVIGFDVDTEKVAMLNAGASYIRHIPAGMVQAMRQGDRFTATSDHTRLGEADAILICVPTPLTRQREPEIGYILETGRAIARQLRPGQLIILQSTTYPGTTREVLLPILEAGGLKVGRDFFLAFSPEREDPGNDGFETATIPKVVGADDPLSRELAAMLLAASIEQVVPVSSSATAEAVKLTENIFRAVNIGLVNELKGIYERMGIDIWEVIDAAKTKPFGFMAFYPGPGLGGHCIPIDPFYLTWKAREYGILTQFVELAGQINTAMPEKVVQCLAQTLDQRFGRGLKDTRVLVVGVAYKKNVDDMRESPALRILDLLRARGAAVDYVDPFIPVIPATREHPDLAGMRSVSWTADTLASYHAAVICTDHDRLDYAGLVAHCPLVVDTRNATRHVSQGRERIVKA
jgi:UDP-N-acetyl-D-glucosamine dehydrogenase